jgi:hypothetical protein
MTPVIVSLIRKKKLSLGVGNCEEWCRSQAPQVNVKGLKEAVYIHGARRYKSCISSITEGIPLQHNTSLLTVPKRERRRSIFAGFVTKLPFGESRAVQQPKMGRNKNFTNFITEEILG